MRVFVCVGRGCSEYIRLVDYQLPTYYVTLCLFVCFLFFRGVSVSSILLPRSNLLTPRLFPLSCIDTADGRSVIERVRPPYLFNFNYRRDSGVGGEEEGGERVLRKQTRRVISRPRLS